MRLPSKIFSYDESIVAQFPVLLQMLSDSPMPVRQLYELTRGYWESIGAYIEALDCLYALGRIRFDDNKENLLYVG